MPKQKPGEPGGMLLIACAIRMRSARDNGEVIVICDSEGCTMHRQMPMSEYRTGDCPKCHFPFSGSEVYDPNSEEDTEAYYQKYATLEGRR